MALIVEQILNDGKVENGLDNSLSPTKLGTLMERDIDYKLVKDNKQYIIENKLAVLIKNITYLGHPHPLYKKRIQMSDYYPSYIEENNKKNIKTLIVGMYTYTDETIYVVYNTDCYINNKFNNSSAHVLTSDLFDVRLNGYFRKIDKNKNEILLFNQKFFKEYIDSLINENSLEYLEKERMLMDYITDYFNYIPSKLRGRDCYEEMVRDKYSKAYEAEWVGFYNEYLFEKFIEENPTSLIEIYGDKKVDGIDLDLKVTFRENFYADLKMHNKDSGIQGNKLDTIEEILSINGRLWYIVGSFTPVMDKEKDYEVTDYWKSIKEDFNKTVVRESDKKSVNERSYSEKMKNEVTMSDYHIIEITEDKINFINQYDQGKNSNGKDRKPKIGISKKNIEQLSICHVKVKKD